MEATPHVSVAGGGVAALEATLALRALREGQIQVELLAPEPQFWYRALAVAEPFGLGEVRHFDLARPRRGRRAPTSPRRARLGRRRPTPRLHRARRARPVLDAARRLRARAAAGVRDAITFRGPADTADVAELLREIEAGSVRHVVVRGPGRRRLEPSACTSSRC